MRLFLLWSVFAVALGFPPLFFAAEVTYLVHPVEIRHEKAEKWTPLRLGQEVQVGDHIRTGIGGRFEITLSHGRTFRVAAASSISITNLRNEQKGLDGQIRVFFGRFWANLSQALKTRQKESFQVHTSTAFIGVKGTRFGVDFDKDTETMNVAVLKGNIEAKSAAPPPAEAGEIAGPQEIAPPQEVSREEWTVIVGAMQKISFKRGTDGTAERPQPVPLTPTDLADEWLEFNNQRDAQFP